MDLRQSQTDNTHLVRRLFRPPTTRPRQLHTTITIKTINLNQITDNQARTTNSLPDTAILLRRLRCRLKTASQRTINSRLNPPLNLNTLLNLNTRSHSMANPLSCPLDAECRLLPLRTAPSRSLQVETTCERMQTHKRLLMVLNCKHMRRKKRVRRQAERLKIEEIKRPLEKPLRLEATTNSFRASLETRLCKSKRAHRHLSRPMTRKINKWPATPSSLAPSLVRNKATLPPNPLLLLLKSLLEDLSPPDSRFKARKVDSKKNSNRFSPLQGLNSCANAKKNAHRTLTCTIYTKTRATVSSERQKRRGREKVELFFGFRSFHVLVE